MNKAERKTGISKSPEVKQKSEALSETDARLQVLQKTMVAVHSSLDLEKVFRQITDSAVYFMGYTTALIMVLNKEISRFEVKSISTKKRLLPQIDKILGFSLKNFSVPADSELNPHMKSVIEGTVVTENLADMGYPLINKKACQAIQKLNRTKNGVLVPLKIEGEMVGVIFVSSPREEIPEDELTMIQNFAVAAAQAIKNAELHTQTMQVEEALRESESKFKNLFEHAKDAVILADATTGTLVDVNAAGCNMLGLPKEKIVGMHQSEIHPPELVEKYTRIFRDHVEKGIAVTEDLVVQRADGSRVPVDISASVIELAGKPIIQGVFRDITERKQVEKVLRDSKEFIETVFESVHDSIAIIDVKNNEIVEVNKAFLNTLNLEEKNVIGKRCYEVTHGSNQPCKPPNDRCPLVETLRTGSYSSAEHLHHDEHGRELYIEVSTSPIKNEIGEIYRVIHITRNITERKQAEREIRENTEDLMLVNLLNDSINRGDSIQEVIKLLSDETKKVFSGFGATVYLLSEDQEYLILQSLGLPPRIQSTIEKLIGSKIPLIRVRLKEGRLYTEVLKSGKSHLINEADTIQRYIAEFTEDKRFKKLVPSIYRILGIRSLINIPLISHGQVIGLLDISRNEPFTDSDMKRLETIAQQVTNIIERKRAEEQLRESEERYRTVIEGAHDMIQSIAPDGRIIFTNLAWRETMGYTDTELSNLNLFQIIHRDSLPHCRELFAKVMSGEAVHNIQAYFLTKDGRSILVEGSATPRFVDGKVVATQAILRDITERKKMEEALQESRKFNSSLLENSPHGVVVINPDTSIRYVNPAWEELNGWTLEEIVGMKAPYPWWLAEFREEMHAGFLEAMKQGSGTGEVISQKKNGELYWIALNWTSVMHNGEFQYLLVNSIDITERKRMEEALRESEEKLQRIFESVNDGITVTDLNGVIVDVNEKALQLSGFSDKSELIGKSSLESIALYDQERAIADMQQLAQQGIVGSAEYNLIRAAGSEYPAEISANVLKDTSGNLVGFVSAIRDITERKKAEEALRESEEKFSTAFRSSPVSISITKFKDGTFIEINESFTRVTGYTRDEVIGRTSIEIGIWANADDRIRMLQLLKEQGRINDEEFQFRMKSGEIRTWLFSAEIINIGGEPCVSVMTTDITERKRAEQALEEERQNFRNSIDNSPLGIVILNPENQVLYCNQAYLDMYGYSHAEEFSTIPPEQRFTPESLVKMIERVDMRKAGKLVPSSYEVDIIRKDGEIHNMVVFRREVIWNGEKQYQTIWQDITENKRAEQALEEERQNFRNSMDNSPLGILILNNDNQLLYCNQASLDIWGYSSAEELIKIPRDQRFTPESIVKMDERTEQRKAGRPVPSSYEMDIVRKDREIRNMMVFRREVIWNGEKQFQTLWQDITERKKAQEQLIVTDRLASVGELAAGVAHELNNPLTSVIGFSQLLLGRDVPDDVKEDIKIICSEAQRTASIVKNLLTFARKHTPVKQLVNINSTIEQVLQLRAYEQRVNNIRVSTHFTPELPEVMADFFQLQQVFLNIIINAEHFMIEANHGGTLTVTTKEVGGIIKASFTDDGPGISKENLGHLFDPFFTTKEVGKGTGLGLSICHGIITEHGGRIYAESELGKGATFIVELPIITAV